MDSAYIDEQTRDTLGIPHWLPGNLKTPLPPSLPTASHPPTLSRYLYVGHLTAPLLGCVIVFRNFPLPKILGKITGSNVRWRNSSSRFSGRPFKSKVIGKKKNNSELLKKPCKFLAVTEEMADLYKSEYCKGHDIPISHLDYSYIEKCSNVKELEKILKVLR